MVSLSICGKEICKLDIHNTTCNVCRHVMKIRTFDQNNKIYWKFSLILHSILVAGCKDTCGLRVWYFSLLKLMGQQEKLNRCTNTMETFDETYVNFIRDLGQFIILTGEVYKQPSIILQILQKFSPTFSVVYHSVKGIFYDIFSERLKLLSVKLHLCVLNKTTPKEYSKNT